MTARRRSLAWGLGVLLVALAVRWWLLARANWLLDGDDALSALMAFAILEGNRPLMLKNQAYAGAWEPYAMALCYALFGASREAAKLPGLVASLALVGATWLLARQVGGTAAGRFAGLLVALPPVYILVLSLKPLAPYTEVAVFGTLALWCATGLVRDRHPPCPCSRFPGHPASRDRWRALGCGLAGGLAFWLHPIAVYYLVAIAVFLLVTLRGARLVKVTVLGLVGFEFGALPVWLYNLQTNGATLRLLLAGSRGDAANPAAVLDVWWNADLPRGLGLWNPWADQPPALSVGLAALFAVALAWTVRRRPVALPPADRHPQDGVPPSAEPFPAHGSAPSADQPRQHGLARPAEQPPWRGLLLWELLRPLRQALPPRPLDGTLILLVVSPLIFAVSGFGESALNPWGIDATGRYLLPVWGGLAVVLGVFLAAVWRGQRTLALWLVGALVAASLYGYAVTDPVRAFQSPYWDKLPADNGPLLATLKAEDVAHVWLNHWAAFPVMLDAWAAGQPLIAYDWHDVAVGGIDRFPEHRPLVERAERAAFVLVTDEPDPELTQRLRELGVTYRLHHVPDYVVVVPLSRPVHPSEVLAALDERY